MLSGANSVDVQGLSDVLAALEVGERRKRTVGEVPSFFCRSRKLTQRSGARGYSWSTDCVEFFSRLPPQ